MHILRFIISQWVCSINPIRIQTGRRDCTYNVTDNVPHLCTCPTLPNRMEDLRRTQHDAPRIHVCLLWRSSYFLRYASLDGDFAVGGRDAGGVVCYQGCVEWRERVWEHGVVVGQLVGAGAAIDVFGAVYWGFEGEGGEWEGVDLMQLYTLFGHVMGGVDRGTCLFMYRN